MTLARAALTTDPEGSGAGAVLPKMALPASGRRWALRPFDPMAAAAIEAEAGAPPLVARLLAARGVSPGEAVAHLAPSLKAALPDPDALADMGRAADRIADAIEKGERCGIFGDYDVDGTCAAAMLKLYFDAVGGEVDVYLPDRMLEGYGPTVEAFRTLIKGGARVIMTVDCGAAAHGPIADAAALGADVVVLDHHQMDGPPPNGAYATVNPHRPDDRSGLKELSAAGVVFMALIAVNRALRRRGWFAARPEPDLRRWLDLAALGVTCDVMPMTGLARVIVAQGLKALAAGGNPGLIELARRAGVKNAPTVYDLGFVLGPRINAAGRIGHARLAFELLTTEDRNRRDILAEALHAMNAERQTIERAVEAEATATIERDGLANRSAIVVAAEGWHQGVIGIVAGRLKDRYEKPVVVVAVEKGVGKGSGRSLSGVDLGAATRAAHRDGLLIAGGGHAMAAGLTIDAAKIEAFARFLEKSLAADVERSRRNAVRLIDDVVAAAAVSRRTADLVDLAAPFGPGNPEPIYAVEGLSPTATRKIGTSHLSVDFEALDGTRFRGVAFRAVGEPIEALLKSGKRLIVAGRIERDDWRGGEAVQLRIVDAAAAL